MDAQTVIMKAVDTVLEDPYWLPMLNTTDVYVRRHDDTDGKVGPEQEVSVTFSPDGDAWLMLPGIESLRFRTDAGGGKSLRTRNALLLLAEAIRRDNEEHPQQ